MKIPSLIFFSFLIVSIAGCSSTELMSIDTELMSIENLKANLEFLASDELEGREATTRGEKLAALYISTELKKYGVKPFFEDSYLQEFELDDVTIDTISQLTFVDNSGNIVAFKYLDDFYANKTYSITTQKSYNLIFVGYGITAPEYNYDDYANINVTGKLVLAFIGEPGSEDSAFFEGPEQTDFSMLKHKIKNAINHNAGGILLLAPDNYLAIWDIVKEYQARSLNNLLKNRKDIEDTLLTLSFNSEAFSKFFKGQKFTFEELLKKKNENQKLPAFQLKGALDVDVIRNFEVKKSYNIVGVVEGNDPQLKNEYVAIGAHYDHEGIIDGKIYNGADDNGSGTVTVMEVAKAFQKSKENGRSILVVFHTAEEKGLIGSEYLTDNLEVMDKIAVQINIDMVGRESIDTIHSIGSDRITAELKEIVEEANAQTSNFFLNYKFDVPDEPNNFFGRSDHYNYARQGIPIVFFYDYMTEDYHKESDEVDKINFYKIKKVADLVYETALRISNLNHKLGEAVTEEEEIFGN
jgi:hypothetical protein